jgi:hypothetical protein
VVITVSKSTEALNSAIYAALPISIATRGIGAISAALLLAIGLHRFADTAEKEEECFGPYVGTETSSNIGGPLRLLGWVAVAVIAVAPLVGYVAFSAFVVDQLIWSASILVLLWLLIVSADVLIGGSLCEDTRIATTLQANTGLRKRSLNQIAVLGHGLFPRPADRRRRAPRARTLGARLDGYLLVDSHGLLRVQGRRRDDLALRDRLRRRHPGARRLHHPRRAALAGEHLSSRD